MPRRRAVAAFVLLAACAAGFASGAASCAPAATARGTRVSRVEAVQTGIDEYDRFFRVVYAMQVAINESERVKIDIIARLAASLGLPEGADLERCAASVRDWSQALHRQNLEVAIEIDPGPPIAASPAPVMATMESSPPPVAVVADGGSAAPLASSAPPADPFQGVPRTFPETQADAERFVTVETRVAGGAMPADAEATARYVRTAIRSAMALKRRMDSIATFAPALRSAGQQLAASVPRRAGSRAAALEPEFRDAIEFLEGASGRAQAQAQAAFRVAVRLQASANPSATQ
jgi:hypothetical protein